mgnify:CR=1 FL=1
MLKIEAKETIRDNRKIKDQTNITKKKIILRFALTMPKPIKTPKLVATPLPPLNPKNIVQLWPAIQATPEIIRTIFSGTYVFCCKM